MTQTKPHPKKRTRRPRPRRWRDPALTAHPTRTGDELASLYHYASTHPLRLHLIAHLEGISIEHASRLFTAGYAITRYRYHQ